MSERVGKISCPHVHCNGVLVLLGYVDGSGETHVDRAVHGRRGAEHRLAGYGYTDGYRGPPPEESSDQGANEDA